MRLTKLDLANPKIPDVRKEIARFGDDPVGDFLARILEKQRKAKKKYEKHNRQFNASGFMPHKSQAMQQNFSSGVYGN